LIFFHEFIPSCFDQIKNVFWPNIFVGASFLILQAGSPAQRGKQGLAAILNQNPIFEMDSNSCTAYKFRVLKKNIGGVDCVKCGFFI
jgi:hypothetical protein